MENNQLDLLDREIQTLCLLESALRSGVSKDKFISLVDSDGGLSALLGSEAITLSLEELTARVGSVKVQAKKLQMNKKVRKILISLSAAMGVLGGIAYLRNKDSIAAGAVMMGGTGLSLLFSEKTQNTVQVVPAKTLTHYLEVAKTIPSHVEGFIAKTKSTPKTLTEDQLDKFKKVDDSYFRDMDVFWKEIEHPPREVLRNAGYTKEVILKLKTDAEHIALVAEGLVKKLESIAAPYWDYADKYYWDENSDEDSEEFYQGYLARIYAEHVISTYIFYCNCILSVVEEVATIAKLLKTKE